jgi:hypothetical protein
MASQRDQEENENARARRQELAVRRSRDESPTRRASVGGPVGALHDVYLQRLQLERKRWTE